MTPASTSREGPTQDGRVVLSRAPAIDLTVRPFVRDRATWTHRTSYDATQTLAATARNQQVEIIRYESVRDPEHAACAAALTPAAFHRPTPRPEEAWFIAASRERVRCARDLRVGHTWEFSREQLLGG